jgi:aspartate/methionine/tyrosine aminotransferase
VYETFQVLLDDGDEVIIPAPYWTSYPEAVKLAGGVPVEVFAGAERGFEPDLDAIEQARTAKTKAIVVNTPSNPTGAVWSKDTITAIGKWALKHHIWVISDEIYEHLHYDDASVSYIGACVPELRDQLLVLNGVAKTYAMTGWRVGWMVAPAPVAKAVSTLQGHLSSNVSNVSQRAALAAVGGPLDAVAMMRAAFDVRRKAIVTALNAVDGIVCPDSYRRLLRLRQRAGAARSALSAPKAPVCASSSEFRRRAARSGARRRRTRRSLRRSGISALLVCAGRRPARGGDEAARRLGGVKRHCGPAA